MSLPAHPTSTSESMRCVMVLRIAALVVLALALVEPAAAAEVHGDPWAVGSKHVLKWDATKLPTGAAITLELSTDSGLTWKEAGSTTNTGRFVWTVPDKQTDAARLRVHAGKPAA